MMNQTALQQKKLLEDFFQAEEQRKQKESEIERRKAKAEKAAEDALNQARGSASSKRQRETEALNRAKAEIDEALTVYQQLESDLSGFTRPKHQLNLDDEPTQQLREMREKLEEAQANFLLKTLEGNNSASACASKVKQFRGEILQKIEDYRRAKSEASSAILKMRSECRQLQKHKDAKYIQSELSSLQNQVDLAEQHFQMDTLSDYHRTLDISKEVFSKISELTRLADQRSDDRRDSKNVIIVIISTGLLGGFVGSIVGVSTSLGTVTGGIVGFLLFFFGVFFLLRRGNQ